MQIMPIFYLLLSASHPYLCIFFFYTTLRHKHTHAHHHNQLYSKYRSHKRGIVP